MLFTWFFGKVKFQVLHTGKKYKVMYLQHDFLAPGPSILLQVNFCPQISLNDIKFWHLYLCSWINRLDGTFHCRSTNFPVCRFMPKFYLASNVYLYKLQWSYLACIFPGSNTFRWDPCWPAGNLYLDTIPLAFHKYL